ncbi:hypothetical protein Gasu2_22190 [Galdieria sulphuraria]|nr:hypothetical protein Gasu2_22190 [Galdieria sulphuraria]
MDSEALVQSPFASDLRNLIHDFIDNWLFQLLSGVSEPLSFVTFCKLWKESNFEVIHLCRPRRLEPERFLQQLFQTTLLFFERPSLVKLPRIDEYLDILKEELYLVVQIACIYILYLLYVTQKVESSREKIRIDLACFKTLLHWLTFRKLENKEDGSRDTLKLVIYLLKEKAVRICYFKLPLQLPQNLLEPLQPSVIFEYELEVEESGSQEGDKSKCSTHKTCINSEMSSLWDRAGEILTVFEVERLEKSWRKWESLLKQLREQKTYVSQFSYKDSFHKDITYVLERMKRSLPKK